jgi:hypothetical protein
MGVDVPVRKVKIDYEQAAVTLATLKELLAVEEYPVTSAGEL